MEKYDKKFTHYMLLSWFVPLLGGLISYEILKDKDRALAKLMMYGTLVIPIHTTAAIIANLTPLNISPLIAVFTASFFTALIIYEIILRDSGIEELIWCFYLGAIGSIFIYNGPFNQRENVRKTVRYFTYTWIPIYTLFLYVIQSV